MKRMAGLSTAELRTAFKGGGRPQLKDIDNLVVPSWAPQWRQLGRQLDIADHLMNIIEHDHHNDCETCCSKMLSNWLSENESSNISWDVIFNALDNLPKVDFTGVCVDIQIIFTDVVSHLCKRYIDNRFCTTVDGWPPYQPKHYTTLTLIHSRGKCTDAAVISVTYELANTGRIMTESVLNSHADVEHDRYAGATKNISDIFVPVISAGGSIKDPNLILIEGAPGIGKTVLAKEIAFQWANNKLLSSKKFLFLIFLRECNVNRIVSVESFVQYAVKSSTSEMITCVAKHLSQTDGEDLAIVFDGYDEISEEVKMQSFVADIIHRRVFFKSCLVITSHPTASSHLHSLVDCRVEIVGFTEEDRLDYVRTAFQGMEDKIKALQLYLQSNPTINALCYIPLNMTILLCLADGDMDTLPKTQTDMYRKFIEMSVYHFIKKLSGGNSPVLTDLAKLPPPHNQVFNEMAKLAYKALKVDKIVFTLHEIEADCSNLTITQSNWNGLGLLKAVRYFNIQTGGEDVTFHFLHFSVQEYMAAYHISTLPDKKQIKILSKSFWRHRYYNTWIMYVGITDASSFALRHFLSGNRFQFFTKLSKNTTVSNKLLNNKIKCLYLFQCLVETSNKDMINSVGKFFQGDVIDLSNQTLLPNDLNTLGFFLITSLKKDWEYLNLSKCSVGSVGCGVLSDRFLEHHIVTINKVDFSFNHLNFESLNKLFQMLVCWHTTEVIITDDAILNDVTYSGLLAAVENTFFHPSIKSGLKLTIIGSLIFVNNLDWKRIVSVFPKLRNTKGLHVYLFNCKWQYKYSISETQELKTFIGDRKLKTFHAICTVLGVWTTKEVCNILLNSGWDVGLFIYNSTLHDQVADELVALLPDSINFGVQVVVSSSKVQGQIITDSLATNLSELELFNLVCCIRLLCAGKKQTCAWKVVHSYHGSKYDFIMHTFIRLLCKTLVNDCIRIALFEKDTLIAHKFKFKVFERVVVYKSLKNVYLNKCDITTSDFETVLNKAVSISLFYVLNSYLDLHCLMMLCAMKVKELFLHSTSYIKRDDLNILTSACQNGSTIVVTKDALIAHNPTTEQIALALLLKPSTKIWKFSKCQLTAPVFYQIAATLAATLSDWVELDLSGCSIGVVECDIIYRYLVIEKCKSTVKTLRISADKFTLAITFQFIKILLLWKVNELFLCDIEYDCYINFIEKLERSLVVKKSLQVCMSVICKSSKTGFFCNAESHGINGQPSTSLYIVNCWLPSNYHIKEIASVAALQYLWHLHLINNELHEQSVVDILGCFANRKMEITISDTLAISTEVLYNHITDQKLLYSAQVSFVIMVGNFLCGINVTQCQLRFLQSQPCCDLEHEVVTLIKETKPYHAKELFVCHDKQLKAVYFVARVLRLACIARVIATLKSIVTLTVLGIDNYDITNEVSNDIAAIVYQNKTLEKLYLNSTLQAAGIIRITKLLQDKYTLKELVVGNSVFTDHALENLAAVISHNMQLKHFGLCNSSFQNGDGIVLTKALQCISNLHRLTFKKTNITAEFADSIGTILSVNTHLQHLDLDGNDLQGSGAIAISRSLQNVSMITSLHMNDNNISEDAADDIAYTISSHSCTKLQELGLSRNKLQTAGIIKIMKALQRVSTLVKLWIDNNNITEEATGSIAAALSHNVNVQEFVIGGNNIRTEGAMLIAKALRGNSELVRFCIDNNNITDKAAVEVAAVLSNNTALQELSIYENGFQSTGAVTIFKALHSMSSLIMLDISNNEIDDEASNDIAVVLHNNRGLQQVNIGGNGFQTMGANRISKALHCITALLVLDVNYNEIDSEAADDLAAALLHNAQLQELNIGGNDFQTAGIIKIAEALQNTTTLRVLDISNNNVTEEAADSIAVVVSRNTLLQVLNISGNEFQTLGIVKVLNALQRCLLLAIIDISNNSITDDAADDLVALLCCCSQLQELYINDNDLCTEGLLKIVKCIQNVSVLTLLDFNHNHLTDEVESCMVSKLTDKKHLHVFNLLESAVKMKILNSINNVSKITGESGWSDNRQIFPGKWKTRQMLMQSWDAELLLKKFVPYMYSQIKSVQLLPKDDTIHRKRKFSSVKVVVVGDDSVGKSCFITHYVTEKCDLFQHATIGSNIMMKMINHNGIVSKLQIWDTSGCQRYNALLDGYIQQTRGIFVLFDFTNWTSFVNVQKFWINKGPSDCYKVLVGYKCDLVHLRQVPEKKIVEFSNLHNLKYFETSARTGININEAFLAIYKSIISMS